MRVYVKIDGQLHIYSVDTREPEAAIAAVRNEVRRNSSAILALVP
jgi:hypothetical protein